MVKTLPTLNKIANGVQEKGFRVLLHPQPVKIPSDFWAKWRKAKGEKERLDLVKGLTKDENVYVLTSLVLDWDSPYEECEPVFLELMERLGVQGYECGRTKNGRFRAVIYLEPLRIEKGDLSVKTFYLRPYTRGKNGHTHLQNFREIVAILNAYAKRKGLKADDSFKRVNHPVWYGRGFYRRVRKVHGETKLYDLYNVAKKLQKEEELWEINREFWKEKYKERKISGKVVVPPFIARLQAQALNDLYRWQVAVKKLSEKYTRNRFTKVILPAVSWAMDLGLSRPDVDEFLRELLPDKENLEEDLEKAWEYARPITFEWKGKKGIDLKEKLIRFLEETEEGANRQFLLAEIFNGQNWLLQIVERFALKEGLISVEKRKLTPGPGRKSYVYFLTEKGKSFVESLKDKARNLSLFLAVGFDIVGDKKSIYKTSSFRKKQGDISPGLVGDGRKDLEKEKNFFEKVEKERKERLSKDLHEKEGKERRKINMSSFLPEDNGGGKKVEGEVEVDKVLQERVFENKDKAIEFLESLNGLYKIGDRLKVWVRFPAEIHEGKSVLYEFEKVKMSVFKGFDKVGERETWELKRIYWNTLRFHDDTSEDMGRGRNL